jgi:hypothetical protein
MISVQPKTVVIKVPLNTQRPFYVFTSGRVIVIVQIHSPKKLWKELKWPLQNGPSIPRGVSHYGLAIYIKMYLKAKEETQIFHDPKYNLQKIL